MKIGFIGLGRMGLGMAGNLLNANHELYVFNRSPDKAKALADQGAHLSSNPAEVARSADMVVTMLADDHAVEDVCFGEAGVVSHLAQGKAHISCSTISIKLADRLQAAHHEAGQHYVSAPVFGRPEAAAAAKLFIVAAGAPDAIAAAQPILSALGQSTSVVSEDAKAANLVKLSGNFLIASIIESLGEAIALVSKGGVDKKTYLDILTSTLFNTPVYKTYGGLIVEKNFEPAGFAAPLGQKDVRLALEAGEALGVPLPVANLLRDRFLTLIAQGGAHLDWSAIGSLAEKDAGVSS